MAFDAYTSGPRVDEGAGEDKRNIKKLLVYPGASSTPAIYMRSISRTPANSPTPAPV